jgi:hypothetical protein
VPILKENKRKYPKNWPEISDRIRFERAESRCEMTTLDGERCTARHGCRHPYTGVIVVLTTAHLNHKEEDCRDENLKAACQLCHNRYDLAHRLRSRQRRRRAEKKTMELFDETTYKTDEESVAAQVHEDAQMLAERAILS